MTDERFHQTQFQSRYLPLTDSIQESGVSLCNRENPKEKKQVSAMQIPRDERRGHTLKYLAQQNPWLQILAGVGTRAPGFGTLTHTWTGK